jgi:glycosyltransferase involved in cell wall biosynthesis
MWSFYCFRKIKLYEKDIPPEMMSKVLNKTTKNICFINNFNNEKFIGACLKSVFNQTIPFDEVILVDDGSTDRSLEVVSLFLIDHINLKIIKKENEGQLSTFNAALGSIQDEAQIFLLDGDDLYPQDYLEAILNAIGRSQWDFAFCARQGFVDQGNAPKSAIFNSLPCYYFASTSALARSRRCWIGNVTSCISISSELYKKIFPYPHTPKTFWVDDLLNYSSSILGAKKIHIPSIRIGWRDHLANNSKKQYSEADILHRNVAISQTFDWYCDQHFVNRYPGVIEFFGEYKLLDRNWKNQLDLPNKYRMLNRLIRDLVKQYCKNQLDAVRKIFFKGS